MADANSEAPQRAVTNAQTASATAASDSATACAMPSRTRLPDIATPTRKDAITAR
jgi:hypothetical protein